VHTWCIGTRPTDTKEALAENDWRRLPEFLVEAVEREVCRFAAKTEELQRKVASAQNKLALEPDSHRLVRLLELANSKLKQYTDNPVVPVYFNPTTSVELSLSQMESRRSRGTLNKVTAYTLPFRIDCCRPALAVFQSPFRFLKLVENLGDGVAVDSTTSKLSEILAAYKHIDADDADPDDAVHSDKDEGAMADAPAPASDLACTGEPLVSAGYKSDTEAEEDLDELLHAAKTTKAPEDPIPTDLPLPSEDRGQNKEKLRMHKENALFLCFS
jgi:hypothetical protein